MARPIVLVFLLLVVAFASQFEWEEQSGNEVEEILSISQKQRHNSKREESVKEKIILSQEKSIQKLNELVRSLREQLLQCKEKIKVVNNTAIILTKLLDEREQRKFLED